MAAAVLLPAGLVALVAEGLLLAEADGVAAVVTNPHTDHLLLHGAGTAIAEAQVVFRGAPLVAVAFDGYLEARIVFQEIRGLGERGAGIGTKVGLVVVEIGITNFSHEEFVVRRPRWWRRWRRSIDRDACGGAGGAAGTGGGNRVSRRVGGRDLGRALSSNGADFGRDGELRGIGGIPAQG